MNSWGNDQYANNMMSMMGNMMPPPGPMQPGGLGQSPLTPLVPPNFMLNDMNNGQQPFIGPIIPDVQGAEGNGEGGLGQQMQEKRSKDRSDGGKRERERDRGRRSRSPNHHRGRDKPHGRERSRRGDRPSKWSQEKVEPIPLMGNNQPGTMMGSNNMMMPGSMMQYGNMMTNAMPNPMMNQMQNMDMNGMQNMDMSGMQNMASMQAMNMPNMMSGMNMMPNMMMMNQQMSLLPMYLQAGVILPAAPGYSSPARRDRPPGCRTVFVGGLPSVLGEDTITEVFQRFGMITEVKLHRQGVCHVRFERQESVEQAFFLSGCRFKLHEQMESEATPLFVDYALNREDQSEHERHKHKRTPTPPRVEPFTPATFITVSEKIKSDTDFAEVAHTLAAWLERGECTKKNANTFYSLVQASNNQLRRLFNEKVAVDEEYQTLKMTMKEKFAHILLQFEQVAKILTAAKHQRASDHFSKQQRRNIEMWLKMTEELDNIKEEFNANFDEEDTEKFGKNMVSGEKYEQLKMENENLMYELEGYKNEAHLARDEAERKFEKFKAHFIAQQALQNNQSQVYPPLPPPPPMPAVEAPVAAKPQPPPPLPGETPARSAPVSYSEAKLISLLTAFLMVHPLGASLDYLVSYVKSLVPNVTQSSVHDVLMKYSDVFRRKTTGVGACIEHKWGFVTFDLIKTE